LVTEKFRASVVAVPIIVRFAVKLVKLFTVIELTVIPVPTFTVVAPLIKFVPVKTTSSVCKRLPLIGEMLVKVGAGFPPTVKPFGNVAVPPPGGVLVTETLRALSAALEPMVILAVICVVLLTMVELTVTSAPKLTELTLLTKFIPVKTTSTVCKRLPLAGETLVNAAAGLFTVKVRFAEIPPPGPLLTTEKIRAPVAAAAVIVRFAVKLVELFTVVELTVMPLPTFTEVTPLIKFVPVKPTSSFCKRLPLVGEILAKTGTGLFTVNVWFAEVPPPGALLATEKSCAPVAALAVMVRFAVKLVELLTVVELTVMPVPAFTAVRPLIKLVPVKTTSSVCKRLPLIGDRLVKVGTGLLTVKI